MAQTLAQEDNCLMTPDDPQQPNYDTDGLNPPELSFPDTVPGAVGYWWDCVQHQWHAVLDPDQLT